MDWENSINLIIGVATGGLITWYFARLYYKRAGEDLKKEAEELRRLNSLMLHGMEHAGWIKLTRDSSGKILGFTRTISLTGIPSGETFGAVTVKGSPLSHRNVELEARDPNL